MNRTNKSADDWTNLSDTPAMFEKALKEASTSNERLFFKNLRHKLLHETAFSNDVLMHNQDNEDGIFILRCGIDDFQVGRILADNGKMSEIVEYQGLFFALDNMDLFAFINQHITLGQWLKKRDYRGIRYDRNNDYM